MGKELQTWEVNFKKILSDNGFKSEIPGFLKTYVQGYVDQLAKQRNEISTLQEEIRELLRITGDLNRQRAELQLKIDKQEQPNSALVGDKFPEYFDAR